MDAHCPSAHSRTGSRTPRPGASAPVHHGFSFEVPEDPLRAALDLGSVLEQPTWRPEDAGGENMIAHSLLDFSRRPVSSIQTHKSALSAMASQRMPNPFAVVASMAEVGGGSLAIAVCFPHAKQPTGQLLDLQLPGNATVEDAIALALWTYWDKHWLPELNASKARDTDISSWIMLVPGKDGLVNKRIAQSSFLFFLALLPRLTYIIYQTK